MFLEELLGFLPKREVEFTIHLKLGTKLIERTPYRVSTPKLQELKLKLKELLDLGIASKYVTLGCTYYFHTEEGWVMETLH